MMRYKIILSLICIVCEVKLIFSSVANDQVSMKNQSDWLNNTKRQIGLLKDTLGDKKYKKYKLPLLLCLAERVAQFYPQCGQCHILQRDISGLIQEIGSLTQFPDKNRQKSYFKTMDMIVQHLRKQHKLVNEGYYMGIGIAIGTGFGVALGVAMRQVGGGIPIGVGIGLTIGVALDAKAKKEGRVLYQKEAESANSINYKFIAIVLGLLVLAGLAAFLFFQLKG
jgi:hypothetical protein